MNSSCGLSHLLFLPYKTYAYRFIEWPRVLLPALYSLRCIG